MSKFPQAPFGCRFHGGAVSGFTLLETCMVLLIIAILMGALMPAMQSAFVENALRADTREISLMVKTAMLQSGDRHRTYLIDFSATRCDLHPAPQPKSAAQNQSEDRDEVTLDYQFSKPNQLLIPDPKKASVWIHMPETSWVFRPDILCPATRIRLSRGSAYIEMSFNPLTGNVEDETAYIP